MRAARVAAVLSAGACAAAGCGGSDPSPDPRATAVAAATPASRARVNATVEIADFAFAPRTLTVAAGSTVTWRDTDAANHNVDFTAGPMKGIANLRRGQQASVTFKRPGTYAYVCDYHANMRATVVVR